MSLKIARRRSKIHGNGVFATADIRKGEEIIEYKGKLVTHEFADEAYGGYDDTGHTFLFILNDAWVVDANQNGNIARWINHACVPNAEAVIHEHKGGDPRKDRVVIEATRDIRKGEEITYDYGIEVEEKPTRAELKLWSCLCGTPTCRGSLISYAAAV